MFLASLKRTVLMVLIFFVTVAVICFVIIKSQVSVWKKQVFPLYQFGKFGLFSMSLGSNEITATINQCLDTQNKVMQSHLPSITYAPLELLKYNW